MNAAQRRRIVRAGKRKRAASIRRAKTIHRKAIANASKRGNR